MMFPHQSCASSGLIKPEPTFWIEKELSNSTPASLSCLRILSRALYVTAIGRRVVVVRAFVKKTQKTPRSEIEIALQRAKEAT